MWTERRTQPPAAVVLEGYCARWSEPLGTQRLACLGSGMAGAESLPGCSAGTAATPCPPVEVLFVAMCQIAVNMRRLSLDCKGYLIFIRLTVGVQWH